MHVQLESAVNFVQGHDRAINNLAKTAIDILSDKSVLSGLSPLCFANGMIGSEFG